MELELTLLMPCLNEADRLARFLRLASVERALARGVLAMIAGLICLLLAVNQWRLVHFGSLNYGHTMRLLVPGATLTALGFQTSESNSLSIAPGIGRAPPEAIV